MTPRQKYFMGIAGLALLTAALMFTVCIITDMHSLKADRLKKLGDDLTKAVQDERYEEAAVMRDEINKLLAESDKKKSIC